MGLEILKVFFYDVRCAVVMHFSGWSAVYHRWHATNILERTRLSCWCL